MKLKGSITIFMALAFLVLVSVFMAIIERGRIESAKAEVELGVYAAQRSLAGYYHNELWEKYDILGLDMNKNREKLYKDYLSDNTKPNSLYRVKYEDINILPNYFNEFGGSELIRQAFQCMKYRIPSDIIKNLEGGEKKDNGSGGDIIDDEIGEDELKNNIDNKGIEDPRDEIKKIQGDDEFSDFVMGERKFSNKTLEHRADVNGALKGNKISENILFNEYILSHFTNIITSKNSKNIINYEIEYILKGGSNDKNNIKKVLRDIKLLRIPINFSFLMKNKFYHNAARLAAIIISGWTLDPQAVKATKMGLLAAWAYAESAIDVKGLIQGKKVPLFKTDDNWNLGFTELIHFWNVEPKDNRKGMNYDDFLRGFLLLKSAQKKVRRGMDLIEANLNIDFSNMSYKFSTGVEYSLNKKFWNPIFINNKIYKDNIVAAYGYK